MKKHFASVGERQVHYRRAGEGPPVVLLPPLPLTGRRQESLIAALSRYYTVIAVDPPGYGLSDPLNPGPQPDDGLEIYVPTLAALLDIFDLQSVALVGEGAGARLAEAFAAECPHRITACVVTNPPGADALRPGAAGRFPDLTPRRDGGHLLTAWDMVESSYLFDPWNAFTADRRLGRDLPGAEALHADFLDYLRAGPGYAHAPRAAAEARPGSGVVVDGEGAIVAHLLDAYPPAVFSPIPIPVAMDPSVSRLQACYIDLPQGQLFALVCTAGQGRPILGLHDPAGASRRLDAFVGPYVGVRPVIVLDLPGSGESDPIVRREDISIEAYAAVVEAALGAVGIAEVDVIGRYSGGQIAMELSLRKPGLVAHIVQAGVMIFDDEARDEHLAHYTPSIAPRWDGSHLVTAWRSFRHQTLFWPWYNRTAEGTVWRDAEGDAAPLHKRLEDVFKVADGYQAAYAASFRYPMAQRLNELSVPCLLTDIAATGSYPRVAAGKAAAPACKSVDLPGDPSLWRAVFDPFFEA